MYLFPNISTLNVYFSFLPFASLVSLKRYLCFYFAFRWLLMKMSIFHMFRGLLYVSSSVKCLVDVFRTWLLKHKNKLFNMSRMSFYSINMPLQYNFDGRIIFLVISDFTDPSMPGHLDYFTFFSSNAESSPPTKSPYMFSLRRINTFLKVELLSQRVWIILDFESHCPPKGFIILYSNQQWLSVL